MPHREGEISEALLRLRRFCPYFTEANAAKILTWVERDCAHLRESLTVIKDKELVKKDFAKLYWTVLELYAKLEAEGIIKEDKFEKELLLELHLRKPYVFNGEKVTKERAREIFYESITR